MTTLAPASARVCREATLDDLDRVCAMFERFRSESHYAQYGPAHPDISTGLIERLIVSADGVVLVAEDMGLLVGMIGLIMSDHPMSGERMATELFWWLEPEHRGRGAFLLRRAEQWAVRQDAVRLLMISPLSPTVDRMYEAMGYTPVETSWQKPLGWFSRHQVRPRTIKHYAHDVTVHEDVLPDPVAYRAMALTQRFQAVHDGAVTFQRIAPCADPTVPMWVVKHYPQLTPTLSFFRQSEQDQAEPHYIHTDASMGDWTALLYLNPEPPGDDGTAFWTHVPTDRVSSLLLTTEEASTWFDGSQWTPWHVVDARFNRLVIFPASLYHSRRLFGNYGQGDAARLLQVVFGKGSLS